MPPRVYLAGPDVFFPDAAAFGERKRAVCRAHGLAGVTPLDPLAGEPSAWAALPEADRIARRNEAHIAACDAVVANLTPFRGPSADAGTVYEVGYARGLGRPVFGYSNDNRLFAARTTDGWAGSRPGFDRDGLAIEDFGLTDNLMIDSGVRAAGPLVIGAGDWSDLAAFERCVALAASVLVRGDTAQGGTDRGIVR